VVNGEFKGMSFSELLKKEGADLMGTKCSLEFMPLLLKYIDVSDNLSIQVHPSNEYAKEFEGDVGKTEAWYIMETGPEAAIIAGINNTDKQNLIKFIEDGSIEEKLNKTPVKKGDFIFIESGLVHAICKDVLLAEVQQNSDLTYRIYDYGRDRELHLQKALDVINFKLEPKIIEGKSERFDGYNKISFIECNEFIIDKIEVDKSYNAESEIERFHVYMCVSGKGKIVYGNNEESISMGETFMIPAILGPYTIEGGLELLKIYMPIES
ncbi:MAG: class I mannose-6-phosphate isomerase, partial [Clostridiales bacterium]|nr:class I mannose-6-phosphate isomerase [Clostridiales bacterium]